MLNPVPRAKAPEEQSRRPPFFSGPLAFVLHYVRTAARGTSPASWTMVLGAAGCAIAVQYVMKLLVDAMAGPRDGSAAWTALAIFIGLISIESLLWRVSGWLGCRTTVGAGVQMRLDLFDYLNGQPMRYFADNLAGSLGQRLTATAGNFGALTNTMVWRILPPCVDFVGALIIFALVDTGMMLALAAAVVVILTGLILFGERGRPLHRTYAGKANDVAGDLVDVISNMWAVKAFSARGREQARLAALFDGEARAQRASWMYTEKARMIHDIGLWLMAGAMLAWAVHAWSRGRISPGDVVVVSALTFRILHGSRDLALALGRHRPAVRLHRGHAARARQASDRARRQRGASAARARRGRSAFATCRSRTARKAAGTPSTTSTSRYRRARSRHRRRFGGGQVDARAPAAAALRRAERADHDRRATTSRSSRRTACGRRSPWCRRRSICCTGR
jgi:ABC-type multidrug transport system fused ATPase/permease subunit